MPPAPSRAKYRETGRQRNSEMAIAAIESFWGKARPIGDAGPHWHPLAWHMLDVGACAGMNRMLWRARLEFDGVPRTRGDEPTKEQPPHCDDEKPYAISVQVGALLFSPVRANFQKYGFFRPDTRVKSVA
jgi:hypothetical protein